MKRLLLSILILFIILVDGKGQTFSGGSGIPSDPYLIDGFTDFDSLETNPAYATAGYYFKLIADVDMTTASANWYILNWDGYLDGDGYQIKDWTDGTHTTLNIVANFNEGWWRNLTLTNINLTYTAGVFGTPPGLFTTFYDGSRLDSIIVDNVNITVAGLTSHSAFARYGGLLVARVGSGAGATPEIYRCAVKNSSLVSQINSTNTLAYGLILGDATSQGCNITESYTEFNYMKVGRSTTNHIPYSGFLVGNAASNNLDSVVIRDCYTLHDTIETFATSGSWNHGGVLGLAFDALDFVTIEHTYSTYEEVGGVLATGFVAQFSTPDTPPFGVFESYYDSSKMVAQISGSHSATSATPLTTAEMQVQGNYVGFDFVNTWIMNEVTGYPTLQWAGGPAPTDYFNLINMMPNIQDPATRGNKTGIGWETNAEFVKFDSVQQRQYQAHESIANLEVSSRDGISLPDSVRYGATAYNINPVFDSVYTRPSPVSDTSNITGSGTLVDPYVLYHATDIDSTRFLGSNKYYALGADIDISLYGNWSEHMASRWSRNKNAFPNFGLGLDGRGYTISNLNMTVVEGGGPTTFITVGEQREDGLLQHIKNIVFDKCSLTVTGNPYYQLSENMMEYADRNRTNRTTIAFIEGRNLCEDIIFDSCSISVIIDTLRSWTSIGFIRYRGLGERIGALGYLEKLPDTLQGIGIEGSSLVVDIDTVNVPARGSASDFKIAMMLSGTGHISNSWIDDLSTMTVDFGPDVSRDTSQGGQWYAKLKIGSITSGSGKNLTECYVGGLYNWQMTSDWFGGRPGGITSPSFSWYRNGDYGLLCPVLPNERSFALSSRYMKRNIFNGNLTSNADTLLGVSYKTNGDGYNGAFSMGDSYYNTDSISANIPNAFNIRNSYAQLIQGAYDTNGVTTVELKQDITYKYIVQDSKMTISPIIHPWDFTWSNWRKTSSSIPHLFGQSGIADTAWSEGVIDTVGYDSVSVFAVVGGGCGIEKSLEIDTVYYYQNRMDSNIVSVVVKSHNIDSMDVSYRYTGATFYPLGRFVVERGPGWWDTTVYNYDITTFGLDGTRPITFKASVEEINQTLDLYKDDGSDVDFASVLPDQRSCQEWHGWNNGGTVLWRRILDVSCGWVSGFTNVRKGEGSWTGSYMPRDPDNPDYYTLETVHYDYADSVALDFVAPGGLDGCRPAGTTGYDLDWDTWLCYFPQPDDSLAMRADTNDICNGTVVFAYGFLNYDDDLWLVCHTTFDDSTYKIFNVTNTIKDGLLNVNVGASVGSVLNLGTGDMAMFKAMTISTYESPASSTWSFGTSDGTGTALPLGSVKRNYFRGIHPKIWKWGREDGTRPDSIWIMTPSGPVKRGL